MASDKVKPIMLNKFPFKKSALINLPLLAGLDRGCSLTKIVYVDKNDENDLSKDNKSDFITLTVALFPNSQFELAIQWMKDHGVFPKDSSIKIHVTGAGAILYFSHIKRILERDVEFMDEFMSQSRGAYHLLANVPLNEVTFPVEEPTENCEMTNPFMTNLRTQYAKVFRDEATDPTDDEILPCVFGFMGSGGGLSYINKKGQFRMVVALPMAGKSFVGLAKLMLGTNDYTQIVEMAERGNRKNVDYEVEDVLGITHDWTMPPSFPMFSMGKLAETGKDIKEFNKEDIAHSLVSRFACYTLNMAVHMAVSEKVKNVMFGGNLFQGKVFRRQFEYFRRYYSVDFINVKFMSNGHSGAIGAMMTKPADLADLNLINIK